MNGGTQELHKCPCGPKQPKIICAARHVTADKIDDKLRQHRNDDAKRQHVEQDGDEDENESRVAYLWWRWRIPL